MARVTIAAAFLLFLLQSETISRRFLLAGLVAAAIFYLIAGPIWWNAVLADPEIRFSKFWGDWVVHGLGAIVSLVAIAYFVTAARSSGIAATIAFTAFFLDDAIMLVNLGTGEVYKTILTPIRHNLHIWAIPVLGYIYVYEQTQERARLERELQQSEGVKAIGQLAAGVAHDFNNLLQVILGFTDIARNKPDQQSKALDQIETAGERAASLVQQLLLFARQDRTTSGKCEPDTVVRGLVPMLERLIGTETTFALNLNAPDLTVPTGKGRLEQIITNLVVNSDYAMPEGGLITIETDVLTAANGEKAVRLSVTDDGSGMDAKTLARARDPFFTTKPVGSGSGLGLATVLGIVEADGGQLDLQSSPGAGTTVTITMPAAPAERAEVNATTETIYVGGSETVLVAEDDPGVMEIMASTLSEAGYNVIPAIDGKQAIDLVQQHKDAIDMAIFDISMPALTGIQARDEVLRMGFGFPIMFTSGNPEKLRSRHRNVKFLRKPFTRDALLAAVRATTASSQTPRLVTGNRSNG